jgi:hypothetical protein
MSGWNIKERAGYVLRIYGLSNREQPGFVLKMSGWNN